MLDLHAIVARATPLIERLGRGPALEPAAGDPATDALLARWTRVAAGSDPAALERRLAWDGLTMADARRALATPAGASALPAWAHTLGEIGDAAREIAAHGWPAESEVPPPIDSGAPLPFEDILLPAVLVARRRRDTTPSAGAMLSGRACLDLDRALLERLTRIAARAIHAEFAPTVPIGRRIARAIIGPPAGGPTREHYERFVRAMLGAGLAPLVERFPVLGRLVATVVDQHVEASAELVTRLAEDAAAIRQAFAPGDDAPLGPVATIRPHLSDYHRGGRTVAAVGFSSGLTVIYKPKSLALDAAFGELLDWCNARGATPPLEAARVLDRGDYGWAAFVAQAPCADEAAAARLYERAGMLLAIVYAFGGTDCHRENLVAAGEQFVLVDLETLMHHDARAMSDSALATDATRAVLERFRDSILRTALVPRWELGADGSVADISGFGGGTGATVVRDRRWRDVNTDDMDLVVETFALPVDAATPMLRGAPLAADAYARALADGFARMYRLLVRHRAELLAAGGPVDALRGCPVRFVFRSTLVYARLRDWSLSPDALADGAARGVELEALAMGFLTTPERPAAWPIFRAEVEAMERLDIPLFATASDADALPLEGGPTLDRYFEAPSHARLVASLSRLDDADLARQLEILRLSFDARAAREDDSAPAPARLTSVPPAPGPGIPPPSPGELVAAAMAIAVELEGRAVRGADGSAAWIDVGYAPRADRFQLQATSLGLYDGADGVALFLAALERVTGDGRFRPLALGALLQLRRLLARGDRATLIRVVRDRGIGGMTGLGSMIYALVRVAGLLGEPALLDDAARAAQLIDPALIAGDDALDVTAGSAGALLALLALHESTGDAGVLEQALACGRHLVERRGAIDGGAATWKTLGGRRLAGFAHGAAGIAHALLRLHERTGERTGERALLDAAREGLAFENSLYSPETGNWPDLRFAGPPRYSASWCNGAAGIALARSAAAAVLGADAVRDDVERAMRVVTGAEWTGVDHLCCGAAGRIDALLVAADRLGTSEWRRAAEVGAAELVTRATMPSRFRLFGGSDDDAYSPGLFRGTAGIGYQLLRVARPDLLPSVLLLE